MAFKRWLYRGGRPNRLAKLINEGLWVSIDLNKLCGY
jgi:hypothetical protein